MAFVMDNATNNNTMIEEIEDLCAAEGIDFSAQCSQLRCMPHTIHLAALKVWISSMYVWLYWCAPWCQLLEAIGAINKSDTNKASGPNSLYQESATLPVSRENDEGAVLREDEDEDSNDVSANEWGHPGLTAVRKVKLLCFCFNTSIETST